MAQLVGALSSKGCGFDSWSGHIPRLQVGSPVKYIQEGGNWLMLLSCTDVSFSPFLSFSKKVMKKMSLG